MTTLTVGAYEFDLANVEVRLIASDYLEETGRTEEAALLRKQGPVKVKDGVVSMAWDKESILSLLENNPKAVYRGLICLYNRQTADEKESSDTKHLNGRGFNGRDARFGSDLAERCLQPDPRYPQPLSVGQLAAARRMLRKYAGQLARVANGEG